MNPVSCFEDSTLRSLESYKSDTFLIRLWKLLNIIFKIHFLFIRKLCLVFIWIDNDVSYQIFAGLKLKSARERSEGNVCFFKSAISGWWSSFSSNLIVTFDSRCFALKRYIYLLNLIHIPRNIDCFDSVFFTSNWKLVTGCWVVITTLVLLINVYCGYGFRIISFVYQ